MAKHKVITTDAEIDRAIKLAKNLEGEPRVTDVKYVSGNGLDLIILKLNDGRRHVIPREDLEGLEGATQDQISQVQILGNGTGLHWPQLDVDHYLPGLLRHIYGTKRWMTEIGRNGGLAKSETKRKASIANGLKGGRPRQREQITSR